MIYESLMRLAMDEGHAAAIRVGEEWRSALEGMAEVGSPLERQLTADLYAPVSQALVALARNRPRRG